MPVTPEIWSIVGYNNKMTDSRIDCRIAAGAEVHLARLIGLYRVNDVFIEFAEKLSRSMRVVVSRTGHGGEGRPDTCEPSYSFGLL